MFCFIFIFNICGVVELMTKKTMIGKTFIKKERSNSDRFDRGNDHTSICDKENQRTVI